MSIRDATALQRPGRDTTHEGKPELLERLSGLHQPIGGLFRQSGVAYSLTGEPDFALRFIDVGRTRRAGRGDCSHGGVSRPLVAVGVGVTDADAALLAYAEGLERYSSGVFDDRQLVRASYKELGSSAIPLDQLPQCSTTELSDEKCPLVAPDEGAKMRWVRAWSVFENRAVYLPISLVFLNPSLERCERIVFPISTGCAAYPNYEGALLRGLLEVIERDALSLTWLQRLSLPKIDIDLVPDELCKEWRVSEKAAPAFYNEYFDATTEIGMFTVYALQTACHDRRTHTIVSCATDPNPAIAIRKTIRDFAHIRCALRRERTLPASWNDYSDVLDGATFMARAEQSMAFSFLKEGLKVRPLSSLLPDTSARDDGSVLVELLRRMRELGHAVYAVDLTTDEAIRCGMKVVRAIVPTLQPLSFCYRARFLGHARLYDAPPKMGYGSLPEAGINPFPQPFA